jgi:hypothetical protein
VRLEVGRDPSWGRLCPSIMLASAASVYAIATHTAENDCEKVPASKCHEKANHDGRQQKEAGAIVCIQS